MQIYSLLVIAAIDNEVHILAMYMQRDLHSTYMAFVGSSSRMELPAYYYHYQRAEWQSGRVLPPICLTEWLLRQRSYNVHTGTSRVCTLVWVRAGNVERSSIIYGIYNGMVYNIILGIRIVHKTCLACKWVIYAERRNVSRLSHCRFTYCPAVALSIFPPSC